MLVLLKVPYTWATRNHLQHHHSRHLHHPSPKHTSKTSIISSITLAYYGTSQSLPSCLCGNHCSSSLYPLWLSCCCCCFSFHVPPPLLPPTVSCTYNNTQISFKISPPFAWFSPTCASQLILSMCSNTHSALRVCHSFTLQRNQFHINITFYYFRYLPYYAA